MIHALTWLFQQMFGLADVERLPNINPLRNPSLIACASGFLSYSPHRCDVVSPGEQVQNLKSVLFKTRAVCILILYF